MSTSVTVTMSRSKSKAGRRPVGVEVVRFVGKKCEERRCRMMRCWPERLTERSRVAAQRASSEPAAREMRKRKRKRERGREPGRGEGRGKKRHKQSNVTINIQASWGRKKKRFFFRGGLEKETGRARYGGGEKGRIGGGGGGVRGKNGGGEGDRQDDTSTTRPDQDSLPGVLPATYLLIRPGAEGDQHYSALTGRLQGLRCSLQGLLVALAPGLQLSTVPAVASSHCTCHPHPQQRGSEHLCLYSRRTVATPDSRIRRGEPRRG